MIYIDEGSTRTIVGGNTVSGVLPELYIYSETGSVVTVEDAGGNVIPTSQVGTDHWTCELPDYGVYTVTSVLNGETTTQSIDVNDCMIYTIDASHFHVNIVVTYPSGVGASCQISGGGETYSAPSLNPPNTSYKFVVHGKNTTYTITTTVDGATKTATVTSGTTIDQTYEVTMSYGQINLTVETPPITGDITCTDGVTTIIKPASANMVFYVPNTGTWDISGSDGSIPYSTSAIVTSLSTPVNAGLNTGLNLASWISAGSTTEYPLNPSSYADFSALEADEAAVRQLMLVHDAVDYLATASAGDTLMQSVINSDVCAKWINLSDYALDTLSANADIKSVMDTADKYGYGEWVYDGTSWGPKGNVPIMTSNTAPYGTAMRSSVWSSGGNNYEAYLAFDGDDTTRWVSGSNTAGQWIGYEFVNPIKPKRVHLKMEVLFESGYVQGSNSSDFSNPDTLYTFSNLSGTEIDFEIPDTAGYYKYLRVYCTNSGSGYQGNYKCYTLQFYGRELIERGIPTMTSNTSPYGEASVTGNNRGQAYNLFDGNVSTDVGATGTNYSPSDYLNVDYDFGQPTLITSASIRFTTASTHYAGTIKLQGYYSNEWHDVASVSYTKTEATGDITKSFSFSPIFVEKVRYSAQAQERDDTGYSIPGLEEATCVGYTFNLSEKEFASGSTAKWIYDHGVELESITTYTEGSGNVLTKESDQLYLYVPTTTGVKARWVTSQAITLTGYSTIYAKVGNKAKYNVSFDYRTSSTSSSVGYATIVDSNNQCPSMPVTLDITSVTGDYVISLMNAGHSGSASSESIGTITEFWLE